MHINRLLMGASPFRRHTKPRCRRALRGPTERNHPNPNRPAERPTENPNNHPTRIGRQSGLLQKDGEGRDGASPFDRTTKAPCRRALRGPNERSHPRPDRPKPIGRQSDLLQKTDRRPDPDQTTQPESAGGAAPTEKRAGEGYQPTPCRQPSQTRRTYNHGNIHPAAPGYLARI